MGRNEYKPSAPARWLVTRSIIELLSGLKICIPRPKPTTLHYLLPEPSSSFTIAFTGALACLGLRRQPTPPTVDIVPHWNSKLCPIAGNVACEPTASLLYLRLRRPCQHLFKVKKSNMSLFSSSFRTHARTLRTLSLAAITRWSVCRCSDGSKYVSVFLRLVFFTVTWIYFLVIPISYLNFSANLLRVWRNSSHQPPCRWSLQY